MTKLLKVQACFEYVIAVDTDIEDDYDWDQINAASDIAIKDIMMNQSGYDIDVFDVENESDDDLPEGWSGMEVPYSVYENDNRTIREILEGNSNNKTYNINIKITR